MLLIDLSSYRRGKLKRNRMSKCTVAAVELQADIQPFRAQLYLSRYWPIMTMMDMVTALLAAHRAGPPLTRRTASTPIARR